MLILVYCTHTGIRHWKQCHVFIKFSYINCQDVAVLQTVRLNKYKTSVQIWENKTLPFMSFPTREYILRRNVKHEFS